MDQELLVEMQIDDGKRIIEKLRESKFDVVAAWWMRTSEEGEWFLYIASKEVDDSGIAAAYRKLHSLIRPLGAIWVDRFDLKLVGAENPITQDVIGIINRYPGRMATRYGGKKLGNVAVEGAYIYPNAMLSDSPGGERTVFEFNTPCFALADRQYSDTMEMANAVAKADMGKMGRCVLLFRDRKTAEDAARSLGYPIVVEVGNAPFLILILDAAKGAGCINVAVDYVRTLDGQACHFHNLDEMFAAARRQAGVQ